MDNAISSSITVTSTNMDTLISATNIDLNVDSLLGEIIVDEDDSLICPICFENLEVLKNGDNIKGFVCSHELHNECCKGLFNYYLNNTLYYDITICCPLCRSELNSGFNRLVHDMSNDTSNFEIIESDNFTIPIDNEPIYDIPINNEYRYNQIDDEPIYDSIINNMNVEPIIQEQEQEQEQRICYSYLRHNCISNGISNCISNCINCFKRCNTKGLLSIIYLKYFYIILLLLIGFIIFTGMYRYNTVTANKEFRYPNFKLNFIDVYHNCECINDNLLNSFDLLNVSNSVNTNNHEELSNKKSKIKIQCYKGNKSFIVHKTKNLNKYIYCESKNKTLKHCKTILQNIFTPLNVNNTRSNTIYMCNIAESDLMLLFCIIISLFGLCFWKHKFDMWGR